MMSFKLSLRNICRSFKDYTIYFFTLILGVAVFYVFNALGSQTVLLNVSQATYKIIELMNDMLAAVSVFVSFILGFLIIYANSFLMKRRHKEFGIYMLLGMSRRRISWQLLLETLMIGVVSLGVGIAVGVALSQVMSIIVANMFEADMSQFQFVFSLSAMNKTILYFSIMYLLIMVFNTVKVGKCRLIELLNAGKRSQRIRMKNPWFCVLVFVVAAGMLGYAYYLVSGGSTFQETSDVYLPIILGIVATFLIFWSLSGLMLKIFMSMKRVYYKNLNSFTLRQLSSKINTMVASVSLICLMLFVTICVLSSALSIKNSMTANLTELAPVDIMLSKPMDVSGNDRYNKPYTQGQIEDSKLSVTETLKKLGFDTEGLLKDQISLRIYATNELTFEHTLGSQKEEVQKQFPYLGYSVAEDIIRVSDYNKVAKLYGKEPVELAADEYAVVADYESMVVLRNQALAAGRTITLLGKTYQPKYRECIDGFLEISSNHINTGFLVVPDHAVEDSLRSRDVLIANYRAADEAGRKKTEAMLLELDNHPEAPNVLLDASTKLSVYESSVGLGAMVTFIGLYLGIIFMICSAAILALKELSESTDNVERYAMLRRLGVDEKMINRSLFRQIGTFFLFPLALAIIHSIFGIKFCQFVLATMGNEQMLNSVAMTAGFLVIIYGGYFVITYLCSRNIIRGDS